MCQVNFTFRVLTDQQLLQGGGEVCLFSVERGNMYTCEARGRDWAVAAIQ